VREKFETILVTGGAGFIGSNFVKHALEQEITRRVVVLDAFTYAGTPENLSPFIESSETLITTHGESFEKVEWYSDRNHMVMQAKKIPREWAPKLKPYNKRFVKIEELKEQVEAFTKGEERFMLVVGSITDAPLVEAIMDKVGAVVNFAAETHVDRSILNPGAFLTTDVVGTYILLEAARKAGWSLNSGHSFLHISTDEVYGVAYEGSFTEESPINPRNPYSAAKAAADRLAASFFTTYGMPILIVRPSNNFGPHQYPEKLVPVMVINALNNKPLPLYGDGTQKREWLFVKDCCSGVATVLTKGKLGEVYNITAGNERENREVVHRILDRLGKPKSLIRHVKDRPGHDIRYSISAEKLKRELGWQPQHSFEDAMDTTIDWYVENREWWQRILERDEEYRRFWEEWYGERLAT
jgi:dTDP-glucose 4,6-dehydratase